MKRKVARAKRGTKLPAPPSLSPIKQALGSSEAAHASRVLHGALRDAVAILEPIHGLSMAQTLVGEIVSSDPPPPSETPPSVPPVSTTLSPQASELVRWYLRTVGHRERETVDGAVFSMLASAKHAHEERGDDSFDILLAATLESKDRFRDLDMVGALKCATVELDEEATVLVRLRCRQTGEDARDLVSAAVLFLLDPETDDTGEAMAAARTRRGTREHKEGA